MGRDGTQRCYPVAEHEFVSQCFAMLRFDLRRVAKNATLCDAIRGHGTRDLVRFVAGQPKLSHFVPLCPTRRTPTWRGAMGRDSIKHKKTPTTPLRVGSRWSVRSWPASHRLQPLSSFVSSFGSPSVASFPG